MNPKPTLRECLKAKDWDIEKLVELTGLERRVIEAIVAHRYTTSPGQRERIARALGASVDAFQWGQAVAVDHMYGHGPQFGRSP